MLSCYTSFLKSALVASLGICLLVGSSLAQGPAAKSAYKEYPPNENLLATKKDKFKLASRYLRGSQPLDDKVKQALDAYYKNIVFREFTAKSNLGRLPEMRAELLKQLRTSRNVEAKRFLITTTFQQMRAFTQGRFGLHPAVRYNAMLLLGELNAVEFRENTSTGPAQFPDPLPAALGVLFAEYKSPDQIDAVRVAALVGINRHVKLDLARPTSRITEKKAVVDEMVSLLNSSPPAGRSEAGHTWMQRRAIDILSALRMIGMYPDATTALEKIVANQAAPMSLRCSASEALARWAPNSRVKIAADTVSKNLGSIAVKACKDELDRIAKLEAWEVEQKELRDLVKKANPAATGQFGAMAGGMVGGGGEGMMGMMMSGEGGSGGAGEGEMGMQGMEGMMGGMMSGMGGMSGMMGGIGALVDVDPRIIWSQRRLKYQLTCVKRGLEGMAIAGKGSPQEATVERVAEAVDTALGLTDPPAEKPNLEGLSESIEEAIRGLAFLAPAPTETGVDPTTNLPPGALPPSAEPAPPAAPAEAAAPPAAATPAADSAAPPAAAGLPPGV
jgi:hypothetical protein